MPEYVHALTPIDIPACWEDRQHRIRSRCGEDGPTTLVAKEATCPACLTLAEVARIRTGVERTQSSIGSVAIDLSVYEGRGDWAALPAGQRLEAGRRGLEHLDESIAALKVWRTELRTALGADDDQADEDAEPPIACALVHEHDPVTCAAPSIEELEAGDSQQPAGVVHYTTSSKANAECGAGWGAGYGDGTVSLWPAEVTCPQCKILIIDTEA